MTHTLLTPDTVCLQVVDVQEKLMAKIDGAASVIATTELMIKCAKILNIPIVANTQYVKGLGPYVANLEAIVADIQRFDKVEFNALANRETEAFLRGLPKKVTTVILVGVETHICIYQTAIGLLERGFKVWIVTDGVSARKASDHTSGLNRLQSVGAIIGSAEMLIYELLGKAGTAKFKQVLPLIVGRGD